jgi:hypothetical protein
MANTIQVRRGSETSLPILSSGEFGFTTDSIRLFMGDSIVNHEIAFLRDLPESLVEIDASNISNVIFTLSNGDTITESFGHVHTNYALKGWVEDNFLTVEDLPASHDQIHDLVGGDHTVTGLTTDHVLTALSET